ncbi:MAG TPA: zinc-ribbon domain-containing protein [Pyrinomonadaceae bacterium]
MYCPKCGIQNNDETKFCRGCGENLKVVSQAMSRHLPVILASKMDAYLERKNSRIRRDSIFGALSGTIFLICGLYFIIEGKTSWARSLFFVATGCIALLWSLWDHLVYKRSLSLDVRVVRGPPTADELAQIDAAQIVEPPASITESTTRHFDATIERQDKS